MFCIGLIGVENEKQDFLKKRREESIKGQHQVHKNKKKEKIDKFFIVGGGGDKITIKS